MTAIINRGQEYGTLNGAVMKCSEIQKTINTALKQGRATLLVDNDTTLAYKIKSEECKKVLMLMDNDYSYQDAIKAVKSKDREQLEKELEFYI